MNPPRNSERANRRSARRWESNSTDSRHPSGFASRQTVIVGSVLLVAALTAVWFAFPRHANTLEARRLFEQGQYVAAMDACEQILQWDTDNAEALAIAGLAAGELQMSGRALDYLEQLPQQVNNPLVYDGLIHRVNLLTAVGRLSDAISGLYQLHSAVPDDVLVTRRLGQLLAGTGDVQFAVPILMELVTAGHASTDELMILASGGSDLWGLDRVRRLRERSPNDRRLLFAELRHLKIRSRHDTALQLIEVALAHDPADPELHCWRLQLTGTNSNEELEQLGNARPTPQSLSSLSKALTATNTQLALEFAIRRVELLSCDPIAHRRLAELLQAAGAEPAAAIHRERFTLLIELAELCRQRDVFGQPQAPRAVEILRHLGRFDEAVAWCRWESRVSPDSNWPAAQLAVLNLERVTSAVPVIADGARHVRNRKLTSFTAEEVMPLALSALRKANRSNIDAKSIEKSVELRDIAGQVGLDSQFYNGTSAERGRYMHEFTGGGVGVLDLDGDDWPDLLLAQGAGSPMVPSIDSSVPADELFRNIRGETFLNVGSAAGITESDFGQGVAVGDVNLDGFDDIYVANIGTNALWINQGDGTFVRQTFPEHAPQWTISAAIADINGDSFPDIYDVNYVSGTNVFTQLCEHDGQQRICSPTDFEVAADELWYGNGDGTFRAAAANVGLDQFEGRGMGIVAGDIWQTGTCQVFVTNDESANFLLAADESGRMQESAVMRGVAFGRDGQAQGSMGIAAGRANADDQLDLFITNYYGELNCLHIQSPEGFFDDVTGASRLEHPGRPMLGFGTQFFDVDADGDDDLFVANGHLDDFTHMNIPYQMRAQLFMNHEGRFEEAESGASAYVGKTTLGRAVAKLDWNRDGRIDLCVTHLDRSVALLENRSESELAVLQIEVTLVSGLRDGTGCVLTVTPEGDHVDDPAASVRVPLLSGDGYACSNQRMVTVAIPKLTTQMRVAGPGFDVVIPVSGRPVDHVRFVEGTDTVWHLPRDGQSR